MRMMRRGDCENSHENHRQWDEANDCIGLGLSSARGLKKAGKGCDEHGRSLEGTVQGTLWQQRGGSNRDQHHTQRQGSNYKRGRGRGVAIIIISLTQVDAARTTQAANESLGILPSTLQTAIFAVVRESTGRQSHSANTESTQRQTHSNSAWCTDRVRVIAVRAAGQLAVPPLSKVPSSLLVSSVG